MTYAFNASSLPHGEVVPSAKQQEMNQEFVRYFTQDMTKTFVVCAVIAGMIGVLWAIDRFGFSLPKEAFKLPTFLLSR